MTFDTYQQQVTCLTRGLFPELWCDTHNPSDAFYQSYLVTYIERDVRQLLNIGSSRDFERFFRACAIRSGQLLNKSDISRDVGVSQPTIAAWLSVLQASNQAALLEPFFANVGKRLVKSPKLYRDYGLHSAAAGRIPRLETSAGRAQSNPHRRPGAATNRKGAERAGGIHS
jgi:predicted AAA+ superfamily ATPase